ncbi:peptidoglycan DD-metalloendopeptidase family protein [Flexithrix dorotheae]|uniref:peptidoglycan DD-metalloendopeptidase family protein n=1 Tax=Flexithrix dorotheae TaxID=70993 RepID=UPI000369D9F9|nr:peptidoglycan DD-metalloendopeptidase family protein [Flexithrix dorotheae]
MNNLIIYLLSSTCCLIVFYLFYRWVLQSVGLYQWNRIFLLLALGLSFFIPLLQIDPNIFNDLLPNGMTDSRKVVEHVESQLVLLVIEEGMPMEEFGNVENSESGVYYWLGLLIYITGFSIAFFQLKRNILSIIRMALNGKVTKYGSFSLVEIHHKPFAFSFFRLIFLNPEGLTESEKAQVIAHEEVHAREWHSLDILLVEVLKVIFWFNPLLGLYKKAIEQNHEFIADGQTAGKFGISNYFQLVLKMAIRQQKSTVANHFANIPIKRRIQKINQNQIQTMQKLKYLIVMPLIGGLMFCFSCKQENENVNQNELVKQPAPEMLSVAHQPQQDKGIPDMLPLKREEMHKMTSGFGMRTHPIHKKRQMHRGVDFSAPTGTGVYATADGEVKGAEIKNGGYGKLITLAHDENYFTRYAQLDEILVEEGQEVKRGDLIGRVGSSGMSTAPHLHYEILKGDQPVDPADYFGEGVKFE